MPHPLTAFAASLARPAASARSLGYRMPAEWEPMERIWVAPPHNPETWPGCLDQAQAQFEELIRQMRRFVDVGIVSERDVETNDSWIRDFGPIFVVCDNLNPESPRPPGRGSAGSPQTHAPEGVGFPGGSLPRLAAHDFFFNGWGGKYEDRTLDNLVPQHIAKHLGCPLWIHDLVLEGGSIDVNGAGTVMTTEQCLLNKNRNPRKAQADIVEEIHEALGTRHVIWLPGGIIGDDTDGHIDDIARFVSPDTVVAIRTFRGHADFEMLDRNWRALEAARDQDGNKLNLTPLPVPDTIYYDFPADRFGPGGRNPIPASYANFLIANKAVFVPVFGKPTDDAALRTLERAMPGYAIIGIRCEYLVVGLGSIHCTTQQQPR